MTAYELLSDEDIRMTFDLLKQGEEAKEKIAFLRGEIIELKAQLTAARAENERLRADLEAIRSAETGAMLSRIREREQKRG